MDTKEVQTDCFCDSNRKKKLKKKRDRNRTLTVEVLKNDGTSDDTSSSYQCIPKMNASVKVDVIRYFQQVSLFYRVLLQLPLKHIFGNGLKNSRFIVPSYNEKNGGPLYQKV